MKKVLSLLIIVSTVGLIQGCINEKEKINDTNKKIEETVINSSIQEPFELNKVVNSNEYYCEFDLNDIACIEELKINGFEFEMITNQQSIIVKYIEETASLMFTDLERTPLSIGVKDGLIIINEEGYETFSFQFNPEPRGLRLSAYQLSFDIFLTDFDFRIDRLVLEQVTCETYNTQKGE